MVQRLNENIQNDDGCMYTHAKKSLIAYHWPLQECKSVEQSLSLLR
jgi:hypothetical protein